MRTSGTLVGIIEDCKKNISKLIVEFENESVGVDKRRRNPQIAERYPKGTPIEKVNFSFSISKSKRLNVSNASVIQFPIKLAFACTAQKVQGLTISKPRKAILNTKDTFAPAMIYVMLSRVCALEELRRLENIALNSNPSLWEKEDDNVAKIFSLNCRSLKKHHLDILSDSSLLKADIIILQETWLEDDEHLEELSIPNYSLHSNSCGRGKGVAIYYKENLFSSDIKETHRNIKYSTVTSSILDIATIHRFQNGNLKTLSQLIEKHTDKNTPHLIVGDLNFCYHGNEGKLLRTSLEN